MPIALRGTDSSYVVWISCRMFRCEMAVSFSVNLSEEDIAVASLEGRNSAELHNDGLRFCLKYRGDKCKGLKTKAQLLKR